MPRIKLIPDFLKKEPDVPQQKWLQMLLDYFEWPIIIALGIVSLILGMLGFIEYNANQNQPLLDILYRSLQLFSLQANFDPAKSMPLSLEIARFLSPGLAAYAVSQAFLEIFKKQVELFKLAFSAKHVVLCGLGKKGLVLVRDLRKANQPVVIIERESNNPYLELCRELGAIVIIGDARDHRSLLRAGVRQAKRLIAVCGDDGINVEIAERARKLIEGNLTHPLICNIHIIDLYLRSVLKQKELTRENISAFRVELFNVYDVGARTLLRETFNINELVTPHLLVIGLGDLGESIVLQAAREWCIKEQANNLHITIVDPDAKRKTEILQTHFPFLRKVCEFHTQPYQTNWLEFQEHFFPKDENYPPITNAYVCFDDTLLGMYTGFDLLKMLHEQKVQIMVRMSEDSELANILRESIVGPNLQNLQAFGLLDHTCRINLLDDGSHNELARAVHEDYLAREKFKETTKQENPNVVSWEDLSDEIKESNRRQADHIGVKLAAVGCAMEPWRDYGKEKFVFKQEEIFQMAKMEHERWRQDKLWDHWKYSPERNDEKKTHPDLVEWKELTEDAQEKDLAAVRLIPTLLARAGFQIRRIK